MGYSNFWSPIFCKDKFLLFNIKKAKIGRIEDEKMTMGVTILRLISENDVIKKPSDSTI